MDRSISEPIQELGYLLSGENQRTSFLSMLAPSPIKETVLEPVKCIPLLMSAPLQGFNNNVLAPAPEQGFNYDRLTTASEEGFNYNVLAPDPAQGYSLFTPSQTQGSSNNVLETSIGQDLTVYAPSKGFQVPAPVQGYCQVAQSKMQGFSNTVLAQSIEQEFAVCAPSQIFQVPAQWRGYPIFAQPPAAFTTMISPLQWNTEFTPSMNISLNAPACYLPVYNPMQSMTLNPCNNGMTMAPSSNLQIGYGLLPSILQSHEMVNDEFDEILRESAFRNSLMNSEFRPRNSTSDLNKFLQQLSNRLKSKI